MNKVRKNNAITLIALVVTVVVLLILAGVSITSAVGDNDKAVVTKAKESAEKAEIAAEEEEKVVEEILGEMEGESSVNKYTVSFVNGDNKILATVTGVVGAAIEYPENMETPTKAATAGAKYTFANKWALDPEGTNIANLSNINSSQKLYAVFDKEVIYHTVTFSYKSGTGATETKSVTVVGGESVPSSMVPVPYDYEDSSYIYKFNKWIESNGTTGSYTNVTASKTLTAVYTSELKASVCFVAGTKVLTETGLINIEDVKAGMKVYSYNEETKVVELKEVKQTFITNVVKDRVKVTVNGEVIESTSKHQFFVVGKGWTAANELRVGDILLNSENEEVIVEATELLVTDGNIITVYNMEVEDNHNYFVGEENVLVHNAGSPC